jgi:hypothetical protein
VNSAALAGWRRMAGAATPVAAKAAPESSVLRDNFIDISSSMLTQRFMAAFVSKGAGVQEAVSSSAGGGQECENRPD